MILDRSKFNQVKKNLQERGYDWEELKEEKHGRIMGGSPGELSEELVT